jgi:hypothetical protein
MATQRTDGFALTVQRLDADADRVLVLGEVVGVRNGTRRFKKAQIDTLFDGLHVPTPSNTSARLGDLRRQRLVVKNADGTWALTPEGRVKALELIGELDTARVEAELADVPGAELGKVRHSVLSPVFAPQRWGDAIGRLLDQFPFEQNVFLMTRFPQSKDDETFLDPIKDVIAVAREALAGHGLHLHLANKRQLDDDLFSNVAAHMWACQYGVALLEDRAGRGLNYNVVIELGAMTMTGRRCAFLRDSVTTPDVPTDFVGQIYKSIDFDDTTGVSNAMHRWAAFDLALGKCDSCPENE